VFVAWSCEEKPLVMGGVVFHLFPHPSEDRIMEELKKYQIKELTQEEYLKMLRLTVLDGCDLVIKNLNIQEIET